MTIELTIFMIALMLTVALATFVSIFSHHIKQLKKKVKILENNHLSFMNEAFSKIAQERKERMKDRSKKLQRGGYVSAKRDYSRDSPGVYPYSDPAKRGPSKGKLHITRGNDTAIVDVKFFPDN
tara:strand:- start:7246 stop:7617 length:372 start_codon:yes stop_codon:yes gene_type:complete